MATFRMVLQSAESVDLVTAALKGLAQSYSDGVNTSSLIGNRPQKTLQEGVATLSAIFQNVVMVRILTEILAVADGDNEHFVRELAEVVSNADFATKGPSVTMDTEAVSLQEGINQSLAVSLAETLTPFEQIVLFLSVRYVDQAGLVDGLVKGWNLFSTLSDNLSLADTAAQAVLKTHKETVGVDESLHRLVTLVRVLSQQIGVSDGDAENIARRFQDGIQTTASTEWDAAFQRAFADILSLVDDKSTGIGKAIQENPELAEEIFKAAAKLVAEDYLPLTDGFEKVVAILKSWDEAVATGDRLRIGGVWADPTTKLFALILKAALRTQIGKVET